MTNFSITVTLKPCMYRYEPEEQYDRTRNELLQICKILSNNYTLIAEITQNMNLHYHGVIELHSKKKWYSLFRKSDIFGFTTCREIYDLVKWNEYLHKSLGDTMRYVKRPPILKDNYNLFDIAERLCYACEF